MKSPAGKIKMTSFDDLFKTDETRNEEQTEKIIRIPLEQLHAFKNHPYKVKDDEKMDETVESIKQNGVLIPAIVRPRDEGGYEIISGHRRKRASEIAGLSDMPVIIRDMDDDVATILLVDSNIQREDLLPSEKAFAYKMKLEAMKRQAGRPSKENFVQVGQNFEVVNSRNELAVQTGESSVQIQRYIRLTELIPPLIDMVDKKEMAFNSAVEISYLDKEHQNDLIDVMKKEDKPPSIAQAQKMKKYSMEGKLNYDMIDAIMLEHKEESFKITIKEDKLRKYFPKNYTAEECEQALFKILDNWYRKKQQEMQR